MPNLPRFDRSRMFRVAVAAAQLGAGSVACSVALAGDRLALAGGGLAQIAVPKGTAGGKTGAATRAVRPQTAKVQPAKVQGEDTGQWPQDVTARYRLSFNKFEVGKYSFQSQFNGKTFSAKSSADVSALFGAFRWKGAVSGEGGIAASGPRPVKYQLNYKSKKKVSVALGFSGNTVKTIDVQPKKPPNPEAVPLQPEHLKNVLDPMSAIIAISHPTTSDPCARTIPVFDGKQRFDLVMSLKGKRKLSEKVATGQPQQVFVCRVKYVPIAGHKPKDFESPWVSYDSIEIALRPVPSAGIYVPYSISIPTTIGAAEMTAESVTITSADRQQIALGQ